MAHCKDNTADRKMGDYWERQFGVMAACDFGKAFTPNQIGKDVSAQAFHYADGKWYPHTLPDITILSRPGEHHEIKHKNPTLNGEYGLESYRFKALQWFADTTGQDVYYTIHNHDLAGGRDVTGNNPEHWVTANIMDLKNTWRVSRADSWVNGERRNVEIYYWSTHLFCSLTSLWLPIHGYVA